MAQTIPSHAQRRVPFAGLAVSAVALAIGFFAGGRADAAEPVAWIGVVFFLCTYGSVRKRFRELPRPHREIALLLLAASLAAQLADENRVLFPFAAWTMYSDAMTDERRGARLVELEPVGRGGSAPPIDLVQLYAPLSPRVAVPLRKRVEAVLRTDNGHADETALADLEAWVRAIGRRANARRGPGEAAVERVRVRYAWLPFGADPATIPHRWEPVATVDVR